MPWPFVLRRLVGSVVGELPGKEERLVRCAMTPYQLALVDVVSLLAGLLVCLT